MKRSARHLFLFGVSMAIGLVSVFFWMARSRPVVSGDSSARPAAPGLEPAGFPGESIEPLAGQTTEGRTPETGTTESPGDSGAMGDTWERVRIVRKTGRFPFVRVIEEMARDPHSGESMVIRSRAMLADHVTISLPVDGDEKAIRAVIKSLGYSVARSHRFSPVWQIALGRHDLEAVSDAVAAIGDALPDVAVEPDILYFPDAVPNDYDPVRMWGLERIQAEAAWSISTGSEDTVVGIIDSGAQLSHPDLRANLWVNPGEIAGNGVDDDGNGVVDDVHGWDFLDNDNIPEDEGRHGTHVAGTIGAVGDNGSGVVGVNWSTRLIILRVGDSSFTNSILAQAIDYVTDLKRSGVGVVATNNSYAGSGKSDELRRAIARARDEGILFVAAAGNETSDNDLFPQYPASYDLGNIISVASSNLADQLSVFSNFGKSSVDLAAPGSAIRSAIPGSGYGYLSGTSMASPHVAGAIALLGAAEPELDWEELRDRLLETVDPLPALQGKVATGGRLNIRRALGVGDGLSAVRIESPGVALVVLEEPVRSLDLTGGGIVGIETTLRWSSVAGPGGVVFSSPDQWKTSAFFPSVGLYRILLRAETPFQVAEDEITVVVGTDPPSTEGLEGFWRFEENGGATAFDSSGRSRDGALSGVVREAGMIGQAARFDGASSVISFQSPPTARITMAAWVHSDSLGEFVFPRIVETPDFIFYFGRRTGDVDADINSIKFLASKTIQDGIWHTANNTIGDGEWLHVAVSYDGTDPDNFPLVFLNGQVLPVGVDARSGDQARGVVGDQTVTPGVGYIGENAVGERAWDGLIDEVRLYSRAMNRAEVAWIAAEKSARSVLDFPMEIMGDLEVACPIRIGVSAESAIPGTTYSWSLAGPPRAILRGPVDEPTVSLIASSGGIQPVRLEIVTGSVAVIREFGLDLPTGVRPEEGLFRGGFVDGDGEVWIGVDSRGKAVLLGWEGDGCSVVQGSDFEIGVDGVFVFNAVGGKTYRGQFSQDRFSGMSDDGLSFFQGGRTSASQAGVSVHLVGPVIGSENERMHALVSPEGQILLVLNGPDRSESASGMIAGDGTFELTGGSGRVFRGAFDRDALISRGEVLDVSGHSAFFLAGKDGFPGERFANASTRGEVGIRDRMMIGGFVVKGTTVARVLVRGVGPSLSFFEVKGVARSTELIFKRGGVEIASNRGWRNNPDSEKIEGVSVRLGAFDLQSDTGDSAILSGVGPGVYTVALSNPDGSGGVALLEIYDVLGLEGARLVNLSTRGFAGPGRGELIAGFVLEGEIPRRVLVRAVGPGLGPYGVVDPMPDPRITLFSGDEILAANDDWSIGQDGEEIVSLGDRVGAFSFVPGSADAALTRYLDSGQYTVRAESADGSAGIVLIEIYVVPDPF